jgi:hypothetical protein
MMCLHAEDVAVDAPVKGATATLQNVFLRTVKSTLFDKL